MRKAFLFFAASALAANLLVSPVMAQGRGPRVPHTGGVTGGSRGTEFSRAKGNGVEQRPGTQGRGDVGEAGGQRVGDSARPQGEHGMKGRGGPGSSAASGLNHAARGGANRGRGLEHRPEAGANRGTNQVGDNAERIRDKQFEQAEHLREVGDANGNERLQTTADRMEQNAQVRYDRRVEGDGRRPVIDPQGTPVSTPIGAPVGDNNIPGPPMEPVLPPGAAGQTPTNVRPDNFGTNVSGARNAGRVMPPPPAAPKNSWMPSWFRGKSQQ